MGSKQRAKIEEQAKTIEELNTKIQGLNNDLKNKETEHKASLEETNLDWEKKEKGYKTEITELKTTVADRDTELQNKQEQLDRKELKKLAQAFKDQEDTSADNREKWLSRLKDATFLLFSAIVISLVFTTGEPWKEKLEYLPIDLLFISTVWFCATQYSDASKSTYDYANRKTLAQSFHNILSNLSEDEVIRPKFIEKATDVLCASVGTNTSGKEPILTKKVLKDIAEILGATIKH